MAIKNYTTKVDVYTSIGEIQGVFARPRLHATAPPRS